MSELAVVGYPTEGMPCVVRYPHQINKNIEGRDKIFLVINNMEGIIVGFSEGKADIRINDGLYEGIDATYLFPA